MHLNIKNDEAHRLATELAQLTGENLTSAVTLALRERLARERRRRNTENVAARLMKIGSRYAALPDSGRSRMRFLDTTNTVYQHDRHR
jgi:antitoxin VapB